MAWSVVEEFVETKIDGRVGEDLLVVTDDFAAVIDGASDATGMDFDGRSGGQLAAETVRDSIEGLHSQATARQFADDVSQQLSDAVGDLSPSVRWPAATVVYLSFARNEIWRVGDGCFLVDGAATIGLLRVNDAKAQFRAALNAALLASGVSLNEIISDDPGAAQAMTLTNVQQHLSNTPGPWGYGVINGRPVPNDLGEVVAVGEAVREVVLTTDGYADPQPTLAESEIRLRQLIDQDPVSLGVLAVSGKAVRPGANSFDDRAYLRLRRAATEATRRS